MIVINENLSILETDIAFSFIRRGGPGGQNVNKVATAVQLRFDPASCAALSGPVRQRLHGIAGARASKAGVIILTANRFRTQAANRRDALARLVELIRQAAIPPKRRIARTVSLGAKRRRLESKVKRGAVKRQRRAKPDFDD